MDHIITNPKIYTDEYFNFVEDNWDGLVDEILKILNDWSHWALVGIERRNNIKKDFDIKYYVGEYEKNIIDALNT